MTERFLRVGDTRVELRRAGTGPPLLVLHGLGDRGWFRFHDLMARRFTVIAPVHPGFGTSDDPAWIQSVDDLAFFYLDLLDALRLPRVHLLGASLGGWIAAELAVHHQHRLRSLLLADAAGLHVPGVEVPDIFVMDRSARAKILYENPDVLAEVLAASPPAAELQADLREQATIARLAWDPYFHDPKLPRRLARLRVRTLVLWGQHDRLLPRAVGDAYARAIPGARRRVIGDAGHAVLRDAPDRCARALTGFLTTRAPRPRGRR